MAPSTLNVLPIRRVMVEGRPVAVIADIAPMVNVASFGMCTSLANPAVASATAAALGVLTPMPCTPMLAGPWKPGAKKTMVGGMPMLTAGSTAQCAYGGVITIENPGSMRTEAS
jgi:hypothetical protein